MFPKLAGGVAVFAHEAWKRYTAFVGPIAAVGYWLGWSVVLAINGLIVGQLAAAPVLHRLERCRLELDAPLVPVSRGERRHQLPDPRRRSC